MNFLHVRGEGYETRPGFNFYPWSERKSSIGFLFVAGGWLWRVRWRRKGLVPRLINNLEWHSVEQRCKECSRRFEAGLVTITREQALDHGLIYGLDANIQCK